MTDSQPGDLSAWLVNNHPRPFASMRLYCFPYAGGRASTYSTWGKRLPPFVDVFALELPGHGRRDNEPFITDWKVLVEAVTDVIESHQDPRPFAFFGHCMGAFLAFEIARRLRQRQRPIPALLAVSSTTAPQTGLMAQRGYQLFAEKKSSPFQFLTPMSDKTLSDAELMSAVLPPFFAGALLLFKYHYRPEPPLDLHLTICGGDNDPLVPVDALSAWKEQTTREPRLHVHPGNHFYLYTRTAQLFTELGADLEAAYRDTTPTGR
jgi:medium-chain acyl-[acyl-carrier-protein] hydrolase